jgi:hypothetical protein
VGEEIEQERRRRPAAKQKSPGKSQSIHETNGEGRMDESGFIPASSFPLISLCALAKSAAQMQAPIHQLSSSEKAANLYR